VGDGLRAAREVSVEVGIPEEAYDTLRCVWLRWNIATHMQLGYSAHIVAGRASHERQRDDLVEDLTDQSIYATDLPLFLQTQAYVEFASNRRIPIGNKLHRCCIRLLTITVPHHRNCHLCHLGNLLSTLFQQDHHRQLYRFPRISHAFHRSLSTHSPLPINLATHSTTDRMS
jgi:hypothetical protein